ncbi:glycosyltransferase family 2 protein [Guptibacillus spartinae]|uniref:glycosyltransferase family 2 protein n=1 Tax=Guptibacillus spartinae TaxID=3025679 RepID=UPI0023619E33|nr:glycosyltransferase family 2 protein [Pseudalkalibacillus spartinae]
MEKPIISVIVPIYNAQLYLSKCINSILNQSFFSFELILINDGSTDRSGEICDAYANEDNRVRVIHKCNEGVSIARNTGLNVSRGKYLMFADADDYVEKSWCKLLYDLIETHKHSMIISGYNIYNYENNERRTRTLGEGSVIDIDKSSFYTLYEKTLLNTQWNKIYDANIIKSKKIFFKEKISLGEDLLFNLEYLKHVGDKIFICNIPLYNYIKSEKESLDNKFHENLFEIYNILFSEMYNCMKLFKTDIEHIRPTFYNSYLTMMNSTLENTFRKECTLSFINKVKHNSKILKSKEFKGALKYANLEGFVPTYIMLLKLKKYLLIYCFLKIIHLKKRFPNLKFG